MNRHLLYFTAVLTICYPIESCESIVIDACPGGIPVFTCGIFMQTDVMKSVARNAEAYDIGALYDYRLDFAVMHNLNTDEPIDSPIQDIGEEVWGVIWCIPNKQFKAYEGVILGSDGELNVFEIITVEVETVNHGNVACQTFVILEEYEPPKLEYGEKFPLSRRPSETLIHNILIGAQEHGLPINYLKRLQTIPTVDEAMKSRYFCRFTYGALMDEDEIKKVAPSATLYAIGEMKDVELILTPYVESMNGSRFTYSPAAGKSIWGVLWTVSYHDLLNISLGGADLNLEDTETRIETIRGAVLCSNCQLTYLPEFDERGSQISAQYIDAALKGAIENELPMEYINYLEHFKKLKT